MIDLAGHDATVERDLGGCPVMHRDFSGAQPAGCHWALADELRIGMPLEVTFERVSEDVAIPRFRRRTADAG